MDVEEQFRSWRGSRKRGQKIPRGLWQSAVELAEQFSLDEIAATLALNYERLEKRVEATARREKNSSGTGAASGHGRFVEVAATGAGYLGECTVEAEDGACKKLTVHLKGSECAQAVEIATRVARELWSTSQ
jgi:hypothetical protein